MAYVPLVDHPKGVIPKLATGYARRRFGRDVEPMAAASHHSGVIVAAGVVETAADRGWRKLDRHLVMLAVQAQPAPSAARGASTSVTTKACSVASTRPKSGTCPTGGTATSTTTRSAPSSNTPRPRRPRRSIVADELMDRLHSHFTDAEIVELAAWVALENYRSRFNAGLGLRSQGFSDSCRVPAAT